MARLTTCANWSIFMTAGSISSTRNRKSRTSSTFSVLCEGNFYDHSDGTHRDTARRERRTSECSANRAEKLCELPCRAGYENGSVLAFRTQRRTVLPRHSDRHQRGFPSAVSWPQSAGGRRRIE